MTNTVVYLPLPGATTPGAMRVPETTPTPGKPWAPHVLAATQSPPIPVSRTKPGTHRQAKPGPSRFEQAVAQTAFPAHDRSQFGLARPLHGFGVSFSDRQGTEIYNRI